MKSPIPHHPRLMTRFLNIALALCLTASAGADPDLFAQPSSRVEKFRNTGVLAGWTGANQIKKISECTSEDHDGNGRSLLCLMNRAEPDTPKGGCHAEVHLNSFPDGSPVARGERFTVFTSHWFKFDENCRKVDVGIWQLKNHAGPERWKYLAALWIESRGHGDELLFEVNPEGVDYNIHSKLSRDGLKPLVPGQWHHLEVAGCYTTDTSGWVQVRLNGKPLTWYADHEGRQRIGTVWRGVALPKLKDSGWQIQLGGYGFFSRHGPGDARLWIDDIRISTPKPGNDPLK